MMMIPPIFFELFFVFKCARVNVLNIMSDEFRMYPVSQHQRVTVMEVLSSTQDDSYHRSKNGVLFDGIEITGVVKNVSAGDDYAKFELFSHQQDLSIEVKDSGMFRDEDLSIFISRLLDDAIVMVRGRYTVYARSDGETGCNIRPKQVMIITSVDDLELWQHQLLESRIQNSYPILENDDLHSIANELGLQETAIDEPGLVRYNYTLDRQDAGIVRETTKPGVKVVMPAPEPGTPGDLKANLSERASDEKRLMQAIMDEAGMEKDELNEQVRDIQSDFETLSRMEVINTIAKDLGLDTKKILAKPSGVEKKKESDKKARSVKKKRQSFKDKDDPESAIIGYLEGSDGEIDISDLRASMKDDGFTSKDIESSIMNLYGKKKIDGDNQRIKLIG